jgi:NAD(P)-dependent dehydrogenase (short-subunit alcohol dehydrogenase family)
MRTNLAGRVAIVTGAAGGIGAAASRALAEHGAAVVTVDIRRDAVETVTAEIAAAYGNDQLMPLAVDITSEAETTAMASRTMERFGRIDALIAAAGILRTSGQPTPLAETPIEEWLTVINVNLTGTFLCNRAVLPAMLRQGEGDIINISSTSGRQGRAFDGPYSASKFGIIGLSESLAEEVGRQGVRVQTLLPDAVDTPLWEQTGSAALKPRSFLAPERIADLIILLLTLPRDTFLYNTTIFPMPSRKRKRTEV